MREPSLTYKENYLRAVEFKFPEYIPCRVNVSWPLWNTYREELEKLAEEYSLFFRGWRPGSIKYAEERGIVYKEESRTDAFGCVWRFTLKGVQGQVVRHPLEDWARLKDFQVPDPDKGVPVESDGLVPWDRIFEAMERASDRGELVVAGMPHGFFFQRLYYLRGFRNLLSDFVRKPPEIYELVEMLTEYNLELVRRFLRFGKIDMFSFGDDLGMQNRMPISPSAFREFIFPSYKKIFGTIRSRGIHVRLHTDGHIMEVADQLVESGVTILNIQDRVNGISNIKSALKGRVCIDLDIDRQRIVPYGTPGGIEMHIKRCIEELLSDSGGLLLTAEIWPPTPLENIRAVCRAFERYMWLGSDLSPL